MQDNEKKPALRFKGFTDPWEQRKFSELYEKVSRKNDLTYGKDDIISVANMYYKAESYITDENYLLTYNVFEMGDIAFEGNKSKNFAHGRFVENTIGNGIVSHVFDVFKPRMTNYDLQFWKYAINNERIMGPILLRSTKASTMMTNLVADDFLQENFLIPCYEEQKKIGEFLNQLDTLITLHQRKYEKLVNIKKSMLDKMFPKNGASVPEIRFKGFTDLWEQRKISELAEKTYGGGTPTTSNEAFWNGNIPWIQSSDIVDGKLMGVEPRKYITQTGLNSSATQLVPKNSIAIITRVGVGKLAYMPFSYSTSQDFLSLSKLNTEPFFTVYACYKKLQSELNTVQGTSIKGITKDELLAKTISVPVYSEQKQIGSFFAQLDTLITLHQRKLEKLQNIKKSCLEKMFV